MGNENNGTEKVDGRSRSSRLSDPDKFRLWQWLLPQKAEIEAERYTVHQVRKKAEAHLNMQLTDDNVRSACDTIGVTLRGRGSMSGDGKGGLQPIWAAITDLRDRVGNLEGGLQTQVAALRRELEERDARLTSLAGRLDKLEVELGVGVRRIDEVVHQATQGRRK